MNRRQTLAASGLIAITSLLGSSFAQAKDAALQVQTYNPGRQSVFPVSASLISGPKEVVLIDAQFQRNDAQVLVEKIKQSGKTLKMVFITRADPDYYFGLDTIQAAFPDVAIVATAQTVDAIAQQMQGKLAYWGPILKDNAPQKLVLPTTWKGEHFSVDGQRVDIKGYAGQGAPGYLWVPSTKTVLGGVAVSSGIHVWMADAQTPQARSAWLRNLDQIQQLNPAKVVPGHYLGDVPKGVEAVRFTKDYVQNFARQSAAAKDANALVQAIQRDYPALDESESLNLSAKVYKGEMKWPQ